MIAGSWHFCLTGGWALLVLSSEAMANCLCFLAVLEMSFKIRCAKTGERLYNILAASVSHLVLWH